MDLPEERAEIWMKFDQWFLKIFVYVMVKNNLNYQLHIHKEFKTGQS